MYLEVLNIHPLLTMTNNKHDGKISSVAHSSDVKRTLARFSHRKYSVIMAAAISLTLPSQSRSYMFGSQGLSRPQIQQHISSLRPLSFLSVVAAPYIREEEIAQTNKAMKKKDSQEFSTLTKAKSLVSRELMHGVVGGNKPVVKVSEHSSTPGFRNCKHTKRRREFRDGLEIARKAKSELTGSC